MIIQVRPWEGKFQIRVLNKPPKRLQGIIEYVDRDEVETRVREIQQSYEKRGIETTLDSWNPKSSSVYVIHLKEEVRSESKMKKQNSGVLGSNPIGYLYVGMTSIPVEERVGNHIRGYKSCNLVKKYFYGIFREKIETGLTYEEAKTREPALAEELRREGYWVYQN
jgi:hypothetical protein